MIIQSETPLSQSDYDYLASAETGLAWSVYAYKLQPEYVEDDENTNSDTLIFDSEVLGDKLYRYTNNGLYSFDGSDWSLEAAFDVTGVTSLTIPPSMVVEDDTLFVFAATPAGIYRVAFTELGGLGSWDQILSSTDVTHIAAVSGQRCHCVHGLADSNYQLGVVTWNGSSWVETESDIYYPYPIACIDAVEFGGRDVLLMISQVPGTVRSKVVNAQVVKELIFSGGIIGFFYANGIWSDHFPVDIIDEMTPWRVRLNLRMSIVNGRIYAYSYGRDGTQINYFGLYREYVSGNGSDWSRGEAISLDGINANGAKLHQLGTTLHLVGATELLTSPSTLKYGNPATSTYLNLTHHIDAYRINRSDLLQSRVILDNGSDWYNTSILADSNVFALMHRVGFWRDDETPKRFVDVQVAVTYSDRIGTSKDLPEQYIEILSRDLLSAMTDWSESEQFKNRDPHLVAGDDYIDNTTTGYGGLTHTYPIEGSFKTDGESLVISSSNKETIGLSTFDTDMWNGTHSIGFQLNTNSNEEYGGVIFRAQDKSNAMLAVYLYAQDKIQLIRRSASETGELLAITDPLSWTSVILTEPRYIRVDFRYSLIKVYISDDGISWDLEMTHIVEGTGLPVELPDGSISQPGLKLIPKGSCGVVGYGFSDEDDWPDEPQIPIIGDPVDTPTILPNPDGTWEGDIEDDEDIDPLYIFAVGGAANEIVRYTDLHLGINGSETYMDLGADVDGIPQWAGSNPHDKYQFFVLTDEGLFATNNKYDPAPTWYRYASNTDMFGSESYYGHHLHFDPHRSGCLLVATTGYCISVQIGGQGADWYLSNTNNETPNPGSDSSRIIAQWGPYNPTSGGRGRIWSGYLDSPTGDDTSYLCYNDYQGAGPWHQISLRVEDANISFPIPYVPHRRRGVRNLPDSAQRTFYNITKVAAGPTITHQWGWVKRNGFHPSGLPFEGGTSTLTDAPTWAGSNSYNQPWWADPKNGAWVYLATYEGYVALSINEGLDLDDPGDNRISPAAILPGYDPEGGNVSAWYKDHDWVLHWAQVDTTGMGDVVGKLRFTPNRGGTWYDIIQDSGSPPISFTDGIVKYAEFSN